MGWLTGGSSNGEQQDGRGERVVQATRIMPWAETFKPIAAEQVRALRQDDGVATEMRAARMQVVYRTWTDVKRAKGSCLGSNITDGQFFAIAPSHERAGKDYKSLPSNQYVCFPAVRSPNYTDEVDIEKPESVSFKAKNRDGQTETVTLSSFLKRIGHFISDLPREAAPVHPSLLGKTNCDHARHANKLLCKAYGDASPVCLGAESQYRVECSRDTVDIGEAMFAQDKTESKEASGREDLDLPPGSLSGLPSRKDIEEKSNVMALTSVMQPVMQGCKQLDTKAKDTCNALMTEARKNFDRNVMWIETAKKEKAKEDAWILNGPPKEENRPQDITRAEKAVVSKDDSSSDNSTSTSSNQTQSISAQSVSSADGLDPDLNSPGDDVTLGHWDLLDLQEHYNTVESH